MPTVHKLFTPLMSHMAYVVVSGTDAAVVDPLRDPAPYLAQIAEAGAILRYIFLTHVHEDFVSGHHDLVRAMEASGQPTPIVVFGPKADVFVTEGVTLITADQECLSLGDATVTVLHTPGHSSESACYWLRTATSGDSGSLFTGDTLLINDVGKASNAAALFQSLQHTLQGLPDDVVVYPGHGFGSQSSKAVVISQERVSTLGQQRQTNPYFRRGVLLEEFEELTRTGFRLPPAYFGHLAAANRLGPDGLRSYESVVTRVAAAPLSVSAAKSLFATGVIGLDTRRTFTDFSASFIPGTVFLGVGSTLEVWAGLLLGDPTTPFVLIAESDEDLAESVRRFPLSGFDHCVGYLEGGMAAWIVAGEATASIGCCSVAELYRRIAEEPTSTHVVDCRTPFEFRNFHVDGAHLWPLCNRRGVDYASLVPAGRVAHVYCRTGYRSLILISSALRAGAPSESLCNVDGGVVAMTAAGVPPLSTGEPEPIPDDV